MDSPIKMPTKNILVVGGCGYIGSHMADELARSGYTPIILDNLSKGHREAALNAELIVGDMSDSALLDQIFAKYAITAVMHFASFIEVGESVVKPDIYYQNNVAATLTLLNAMLRANVKHFIFSSTAAVYGEPEYTPIDENHRIAPINPYGRSKWMVEQILKDYAHAYGLRYAVLRYFNAAGADLNGQLAECHEPESHLIPLVLQVASGRRQSITIYGNDYDTFDGTCLRDYIHVTDLCAAHKLALQALYDQPQNLTYNLGTGQGYSVKQVIETAQRVTGQPISVVEGKRRVGDPAVLVADASLAQKELRWQPQHSDLETIITTAWKSAKHVHNASKSPHSLSETD